MCCILISMWFMWSKLCRVHWPWRTILIYVTALSVISVIKAMGLGRPSLSLLSAVKKCFVRFCLLQVPKEEDYDEMNLCTNCNQPLALEYSHWHHYSIIQGLYQQRLVSSIKEGHCNFSFLFPTCFCPYLRVLIVWPSKYTVTTRNNICSYVHLQHVSIVIHFRGNLNCSMHMLFNV